MQNCISMEIKKPVVSRVMRERLAALAIKMTTAAALGSVAMGMSCTVSTESRDRDNAGAGGQAGGENLGIAAEELSTCPYNSYLCGQNHLGGPNNQLYYCSGAGATPKLVEQCVGTCIMVSNANDKCPVLDGWSSQTGYRKPVDTVLNNIVNSLSNGNAPQSISGSPWLTDAYNTPITDGQRMRNALNDLQAWYNAQSPKPALPLASIPASLRSTMASELIATNSYNSTDAGAFVTQMVAVFNGSAPTKTASDDTTLAYLRIHAMCKEYADRTVRAGGGIAKGYTSSGAVAARDIRQGMYAFLYSGTKPIHAAVIADVSWQGGNPVSLKLAESNWGTGWSNPTGEKPWLRTVTTTRPVAYSGAGYVVISSL
jgi:hypothetical protein